MSIAVPVLAVLVLAGFSVGAAILTSVAADRPERAAMVVVLAGAGGAVAFVMLALLVLGVGGVEQSLDGAVRQAGEGVDLEPVRAGAGIGGAVLLLATAGWLVRTGDWARVDRGDEGEEGPA